MSALHKDIRGLCRLAQDLISAMPANAKPGTPRRRENRQLRASPGGGGREQALLVDDLNVDAQFMAGNLTLIVDGVADCVEVGEERENAVNRATLSLLVRSALEVAGQMAWLLDDAIEGTERARRFLTWRLADLRQQRLLLRDFQLSSGQREEAEAELQQIEKSLLQRATAAEWATSATVVGPKGFEAAALLDTTGKRETIPKNNELVSLVSRRPSVYGLLSVSAHGGRFGVFHRVEVADTPGPTGLYEARIRGFGIEPNVCIGLAALAIDVSCRSLANWNGVDAGPVRQAGWDLMGRVGLT
jgi:hypothetical protein